MAHLAQKQFARSAVASDQELSRWGDDYQLDATLLADPFDTLAQTQQAAERTRLLEMAQRPLGAMVAQNVAGQ